MYSPIAVFAFNRPDHLRKTLTALAANDLAGQSELVIFCDGPRNAGENAKVAAVREVSRNTKGFKSCTVVERAVNKGLAASIIEGVTTIIEERGTVIVVEDDLVTSPYFLRYMNDGLTVYRDYPKVASIHGWCFPHSVSEAPETFFLRGADCWGWGTWKRAWDIFEPDAGKLLTQLKERGLASQFDLDGSYSYTGMLQGTLEGKIDSWAVRWHASAFLRDMYTLYPGRSLVENIGFDNSGTHCSATDQFHSYSTSSPVCVELQEIQESSAMRKVQAQIYAPRATQRSRWVALLKKCIALFAGIVQRRRHGV